MKYLACGNNTITVEMERRFLACICIRAIEPTTGHL